MSAETVAALGRAARRRLPAPVWSLVNGGTQGGVTRGVNEESFSHLGLLPRVCAARWDVDSGATVLGQRRSLPVVIAPLAAQGLTPQAELLQARAAAAFGVPQCVSNFSSVAWQNLTGTGADVWAQLYWVGGREDMMRRLSMARSSGISTIVLTLDWSFPAGRDWGTPAIPNALGLRALAQWVPAAITRPQWSLGIVRSRTFPPLRVPNFAENGALAPTFGEVMARWRATAFPTWDDVSWLRGQWEGTLILKGILHPDDAERAVDAGADCLVVSNHGGNDLDTTPSTVNVFPTIREVVNGRVPLGLDGGVRRGADVVKAIALGAEFVLLGRAAAWAVAADGLDGVTSLFSILDRDVRQTLRALGVSTLREVGPGHLIMK